MGKRAPSTRQPLSAVGVAALKKIPSGPMLDQIILLYRPRPELIGSTPGKNLMRNLYCERNLYALCLDAVTGDPEEALKHPDSAADRVRRALVYNPRLSELHQNDLADMALKTNSAPLVMAILDGTTRITYTLTERPELLKIVSTRAGQVAPLAVARNLHESAVDQIEHLRTKFESLGNRAQTPLRSIVLEATRILLRDISDGKRASDLHILSALCSLVPGFRPGNLNLPAGAYTHLEELPGRVVLPIVSTFSIKNTGDNCEKRPFTNAWHYDKSAVLDCVFNNQVHQWSYVAVTGIGAMLAYTFSEIGHLQTFESLLPEWTGTLRELLNVAVKL